MYTHIHTLLFVQEMFPYLHFNSLSGSCLLCLSQYIHKQLTDKKLNCNCINTVQNMTASYNFVLCPLLGFDTTPQTHM